MKSKLLYALFFLNFVFFITSSAKAQWQPCQGLEGSSVSSIIASDTLLFATCSSNGIFSRTLNSDWELLNRNPSVFIIQSDTCIITYGNMSLVIRSFDNGQSWEEIDDASIELTFLNEVLFFKDHYDSVCRSYDYGDTYQVIFNDLEEVDKIFADDSLLLIRDNYSGHMYKSIDYGDSWDTLPIYNLPDNVYDIACYNNTIWLGTSSGAYCLNNDGSNWIEVNNSLPENNSINDFLEVNNELYCGTNPGGIYLWDSGDSAWIQYSNTEKDIRKLTYFNNEIFCATPQGPFSLDSSGNWHPHLEGLMHRTITSMDTFNSIIYTCADFELFKSSDHGETFEKIENASGYKIITTDSLFYLVSYTGIYTSKDTCNTWDTISSGIEGSIRCFSITKNYYYVRVNQKILRSETDSINWILLENNIQGSNIWYIEAIDSVVIASIYDSEIGLYISRDYGLSFEPMILNEPFAPIIHKDDNRFFISLDVPYFSDDLGLSWQEIPVPDTLDFYAITMDQSNDYFAIGGVQTSWPMGLFLMITDDWGYTWTLLHDNLPSPGFNPLIKYVKIINNRIFTSPIVNNLWYRDDILTGISENKVNKNKHGKIHLYPNPVKDMITLEFSSILENCQFRIFDIQGREQIHGRFSGMKTEIDLGKLKAGIYFIEVLTTSGKTNHKIVKY
jgi:photosystem II stability/assembly factor-like uncharacterized protein